MRWGFGFWGGGSYPTAHYATTKKEKVGKMSHFLDWVTRNVNFCVFSLTSYGIELHFFLLSIFEVRKISTKRNFNYTNRKLSGALRMGQNVPHVTMSRTQRSECRDGKYVKNRDLLNCPTLSIY